MFIRRTDAEAETPILWPPNAKSWLISKDPNAGKDWGQEEKGTTEDELLDGITNSMDMGLGELRELVIDWKAWRTVVHGVAKSQTWLSNWTELKLKIIILFINCQTSWERSETVRLGITWGLSRKYALSVSYCPICCLGGQNRVCWKKLSTWEILKEKKKYFVIIFKKSALASLGHSPID